MTDIVERLRDPNGGLSYARLYEAADEIERWKATAQAHNDSLVARIEEVERLNDKINQDAWVKPKLVTLRAENEALRERVTEAENRQGLAEIEVERLSRGWDHGALYEKECKTLRAENERLKDLDQAWLNAEGKISDLEAENERLREALHEAYSLGRTDEARPADDPGSATYNERWKSKP
jgi:chromosome segregation ATPase